MTLEEMYQKYGRIHRARAYHMLGSPDDAEDAVQAAFLKLLVRQQKTGQTFNASYLDQTVRCMCLDWDAKKKRQAVVAIETPEDPHLLCDDPGYQEVEQTQIIEKMLKRLTPQQAEVIRLQGEGYSLPETAELIGISVDAVKKLRQRGQRQAQLMAS